MYRGKLLCNKVNGVSSSKLMVCVGNLTDVISPPWVFISTSNVSVSTVITCPVGVATLFAEVLLTSAPRVTVLLLGIDSGISPAKA